MKRFLTLGILATLVFMWGCTDRRYMSERMFWHAERKVAEIMKESDGRKLSDARLKEVIDLYEEVAESYPLEPVAANIRFVLSRIYFAQGKTDQARRELTHVIQNFSSNTDVATRAYFGIGNVYESERRWDKAEEEYEKLIDIYPLSTLGLSTPIYIVQHYQKAGDLAGQEKAYAKALKGYQGLLDQYQGTSVMPVIQDHMASLHILMGKPREALKLWDRTLKEYDEGPVAAKAYISKGGVYEQQMKDLPKAIGVYKEFLQKFPDADIAKTVQYRVGRLYLANEQLKEAKEVFYSVIAGYPDQEKLVTSSYAGLAQCYRKEANTEKVIEMYEKIVEEFPHSAAAIAIPFLTAQYYDEIKYSSKAKVAYAEAISVYNQMLEAKKGRSEKEKDAAMHFLALSHIKSQNWDDALVYLRQLIERHPNNPSYLIDIAAVHRNLHNIEGAINIYEELLARYPRNAFIVKFARSQIDILRQDLAE